MLYFVSERAGKHEASMSLISTSDCQEAEKFAGALELETEGCDPNMFCAGEALLGIRLYGTGLPCTHNATVC